VFRTSEKDFIEDLSTRIEVMRYPTPSAILPEAKLMDTVMKNLTEKRVLNMEYVAISTEITTEREIEPLGVFYSNKHWHLIAYCRLRQDYRDFRLDRITKVEPTRFTFKTKHPSLQEYLKNMLEKNDLERVVIAFQSPAVKHICEQKYYYGYINEEKKGDTVEMTFLTPSIPYIARWLLTFANQAEVISPFKLKEEMRSLVETLYDHYNNYDFVETLLT
jgi:predicted DNA-binding transcriptional regulator YafY